MSNILKRKADELDDSDEEEPMLGRQVLPVANLPETFDGVPMDGLQYLFTVRRDARLLPHTTRVANPYEVPEVPSPSATDSPGLSSLATSARKDVLPSEEWRETFLRRFKNFRKNSVQPTIHVHIPDTSAKLMPDKKERDLWWAFLAGRPESEWNPPKKPKQQKISRWQQRNLRTGRDVREGSQDDTTLSYDVGESSSGLPEFTPVHPANIYEARHLGSVASSLDIAQSAVAENGARAHTEHTLGAGTAAVNETPAVCLPREPTPELLQHMDHRYAIHLLMYFGHWISVRLEEGSLPYTDVTQSHARWMFSLLSRVDDWISGDETSLLRTLARGCMGLMAERRKRPEVTTDSTRGEESSMIDDKACWMIIAAITGLWGQSDLWQDAESLLLKVEPEPVVEMS